MCVVDKYIKLNKKTSFVIIYRFKQHLLNYAKVWGMLFVLGENLTVNKSFSPLNALLIKTFYIIYTDCFNTFFF